MAGLLKRIRDGVAWRHDSLVRRLGNKQTATCRLASNLRDFGIVREICSLKGRETQFNPPCLYDVGLQVVRQTALTVPAPDVHLVELSDVEVVGGTMGILRDGMMLHPELGQTNRNHDSKLPAVYQFADEARTQLRLNTFTVRTGQRRIPMALHLLKEHSFNYYHWIAECLPRLIFFLQNTNQLGANRRLTILVDAELLDQYIESLRRLVSAPLEIVVVRRGERIRCDQLFYVSPFWYALDNTKHRVDPRTEFAVDKYALQLVRNAFVPSGKLPGAPKRKIFLPRKAGQVRRIINAREVEQIMIRHGYESLYLDGYTFAQQVDLFANARCVVGATGAAFSNIAFMSPGSKAVIFSPKQFEVFNYYIFQQHADVAGAELAHLLATPTKPDNFRIHDDFVINIQDLETLVRRLEAGS